MEYMTANSGKAAMEFSSQLHSGKAAMELGAKLGRLGPLAVGAGGELAWMLARCAGCGAALAGTDVLFHDGSDPAAGAWLARRYSLPAALWFLEEGGRARVWLCDGKGRALAEERLPPAADRAGSPGRWDRLCGTDSARAAHAVGARRLADFPVYVEDSPNRRALRLALERLGCDVLARPRPGVPTLCSDRTGFCLTVRDGTETLHPLGQDAVAAAVDWCVSRARRTLPLPAFGQGRGRREV